MAGEYKLDQGIITFSSLSQYPNLVYGVTTRDFSPDPFDKLSMLKKIIERLRIEPRLMVCAHQVHETTATEIKSADFPGADFIEIPATDALITTEPGVLIAVVSADCVPVFLADPRGPQIAVIHAGWRGTYGQIVRKTMRAFQSTGAKPFRTIAQTGPCISQKNYQVSEELIEQFRDKFPACAAAFEGRQLDLELINLHQLQKAGVPLDNIHLASLCTFDNTEICASYRRDGKQSGRLYSFMMIR